MKTNPKKIIAFLLTLCLVGMPFVTLAEDAGVSVFGEGKISEEPITLTVLQRAIETSDEDQDLWFYQELEKKTNIHIKWSYVAETDWSTRINLMAASGEYPDVISRGVVDVEDLGVLQGILLPLDDLIPQYMPNYYARLQMNDADASLYASDGHMYYIGNLIAQNVNHNANFYINQKWLDNLGLQAPATVDELTEVLRAFRDQDANGNGDATDEVPMSASLLQADTQGIYTFFPMFGVPLIDSLYLSIDDSQKVVFPGFLPGFRAACEWLALCYEEGLLDKEALTLDYVTWATKINDDKVGFMNHLRLLASFFNEQTCQNFTSILPPASEYGVSVPRILEVPDFGAALTIANKHVPETLMWLDAQFETETMMVGYNGPIKVGGPIEPTLGYDEATGKYYIISLPADNGLYDYVPVINGLFFAPGDYYFDIYTMPPHRVERFESSRQYEEAGVLETYSYNYLSKFSKMNNDDAIEAQNLYVDIQKFMQESITKFIREGVTDKTWDSFIQQANNIGVERYVELYQNAYDAYLASVAE